MGASTGATISRGEIVKGEGRAQDMTQMDSGDSDTCLSTFSVSTVQHTVWVKTETLCDHKTTLLVKTK